MIKQEIRIKPSKDDSGAIGATGGKVLRDFLQGCGGETADGRKFEFRTSQDCMSAWHIIEAIKAWEFELGARKQGEGVK